MSTLKYLICFIITLVFVSNAFAFEAAPPISDREIIESLVELKAGQDKLNSRMDGMNKRLDDMNNRFDDMKGLLYVILAGIFGLFGFVLWDRRTALAPVIKKNKELARDDAKIAEAMKHAGLM